MAGLSMWVGLNRDDLRSVRARREHRLTLHLIILVPRICSD
uniref:Uncharacterized protein n=1 Tax=Rhizophora mucronata TaxID=61149 RepID=A0A2P2JBM8_RHIMU